MNIKIVIAAGLAAGFAVSAAITLTQQDSINQKLVGGEPDKHQSDYSIELDNGASNKNSSTKVNVADAVNRKPDQKNIEDLRAFAKTFSNKGELEKFKTSLNNALIDNFGAEEAEFRMYLMNLDWESIIAEIKNRSEITGVDYGELKMVLGLSKGVISGPEILDLVIAGHSLPGDAIINLASAGNIDAIEFLASGGHLNLSHTNAFTGTNALGRMITHLGTNPNKYGPKEAVNIMERMVNLGLQITSQSAGTSALDHALRVNRFNADINFEITKFILDTGTPVMESHIRAISTLADADLKNRFDQLINNYL